MTCARPLAFEHSGRTWRVTKLRAQGSAAAYPHPYPQARTVQLSFYRILFCSAKVLPCERPEHRAILWRLCLTVTGLRKSQLPHRHPAFTYSLLVVAWAVP